MHVKNFVKKISKRKKMKAFVNKNIHLLKNLYTETVSVQKKTSVCENVCVKNMAE
jgi:hypothetical protein